MGLRTLPAKPASRFSSVPIEWVHVNKTGQLSRGGKLIRGELFGSRIELNHVVGGELGKPNDVVLIDGNGIRLAVRMRRIPFLEIPGLRVKPRELTRTVLRDPEYMLRIEPEPAGSRV